MAALETNSLDEGVEFVEVLVRSLRDHDPPAGLHDL
jgi:hypothetical protein